MIPNEKEQKTHGGPQILAFGEILFDCLEGTEHLGGAPLNFACYVRQFGIPVGLVSAVGKDARGEIALRHLIKSDVQVNGVTTRQEPTGIAHIELVNGNPEFTMEKYCAWEQITLSSTILETKPDLLYFGTMAQTTPQNLTTLNALCNLNPQHVLVDLNLRPHLYSQSVVLESINKATILKMNEEEWGIIQQIAHTKTPEDLLIHFTNLQIVAITFGSAGADLHISNKHYSYAGTKMNSIDQVGAGDAFTAALAVGVIQHQEAEHILRVACNIGAAASQAVGALVDLPQYLLQFFSQE
jgi:fructokinase